jgi:hypothetical protein
MARSVQCVEKRFDAIRAPHSVQWLSDNGSIFAAHRTIEIAFALNPMGEVEITDPKKLVCSADDDVPDKPVQGCYITPMAGSSLDADTVRVRWLSLEADAALHLPRWQSMLGSDEAARAEHFHFARDRHVFIAAHALARAMLSEATGLPTAVWRRDRCIGPRRGSQVSHSDSSG